TKLRDDERELERRSRQEARQYLLEARHEVERAIRGAQESAATPDAARAARRRVEELATEQAAALDALERTSPSGERSAPQAVALTPGATVEVRALGGRTAQLLELRGADALIAMGSVRLSVPVQDLSPVRTNASPPEPVPMRGTLPDEHAVSEIDVRGLRVDEMEQVVMQALDAAIVSDMPALRIIHGKGTGALRERVAELLRGDARVRSQRMGAWNEGGAGVTIAQIR
ncbi:MAG: Smr/MutS family protein, partial [Gemmatimonadaceae bacterium]